MNLAWKIIGGGVLVTLIAATAKGASLSNLGKELVVDTDTKVSVRNKAIQIVSVPTLKNPTGESISFYHPFVRIQFEEDAAEPFASSEILGTKYTLEPNSQLELDPIRIEAGLADLLRAIPKLAAQIRDKKGLEVYVKYIVNLTDRSVPIKNTEAYRLKFDSIGDLLKAAAS